MFVESRVVIVGIRCSRRVIDNRDRMFRPCRPLSAVRKLKIAVRCWLCSETLAQSNACE